MRAGQYLPQPGGYRAFIPASLPPRPSLELGQEMLAALSKADRALGRLDGSIQTLPDPDLFVFMYVRKEAVLSSQIEGTQSSLNDVLEVEAQLLDPDHPADVEEVLNYVAAMNYGLERLQHLPLSVRLMREIHARLMSGVRGEHLEPGELRTSQNWIGPAGSMLADASFVPPPPSEVLQHLGALETFIHAPSDMPVLMKIGLVHAQFETIHPFLDGNGRIGRLLITFLLCANEILLQPVLYLSHFLKRHRSEYYDRLQAIRDHGDWEGWMLFFLRGVAEVSLEATATARAILQLREDHRKLITRDFGRAAGNGMTILEELYRTPIITVANIERVLGVTFQAANNMVARLVASGILEEFTGQQRYRRFRYRSYIALFANEN